VILFDNDALIDADSSNTSFYDDLTWGTVSTYLGGEEGQISSVCDVSGFVTIVSLFKLGNQTGFDLVPSSLI